jgi:hypothetical protein
MNESLLGSYPPFSSSKGGCSHSLLLIRASIYILEWQGWRYPSARQHQPAAEAATIATPIEISTSTNNDGSGQVLSHIPILNFHLQMSNVTCKSLKTKYATPELATRSYNITKKFLRRKENCAQWDIVMGTQEASKRSLNM